jgi:hypothetical protein
VAAPSIDNSVDGESLSTKYVLMLLKEIEKQKCFYSQKNNYLQKNCQQQIQINFTVFILRKQKTWIKKIWSTYTDCF